MCLVTEGHDALSLQVIYRLLNSGQAVCATVTSATQERVLRDWVQSFEVRTAGRAEVVRWNLFSDPPSSLRLNRFSSICHNMNAAFRYEGRGAEVGDRTRDLIRAASKAGVKRAVVTSSFASIGFGDADREAPYTEEDWSNLSSASASERVRVRTNAEKLLWSLLNEKGPRLQTTVINPVDICGPVPADYSITSQMIRRVVEGSLRRIPRLFTGVVDVRDLADLHLLALKTSTAVGERYIASAVDHWLPLDHLAELSRAAAVPNQTATVTKALPNFLLRLAALADPSLRIFMREHEFQKAISIQKAILTLGWRPRSVAETVRTTAESVAGSSLKQKFSYS